MINFRRLLKDSALIIAVSCIFAVSINMFNPRGFVLVGKKEMARRQVVTISALEARIKHDSDVAVFVDTRNSGDYRKSSIRGAVSIPAFPESVRMKELEKNFPLISSEKELVLFCTGAACSDSAAVADALIEMGYARKIYFIDGGFPGWKEEGYALQGEEEKP